jgi:hypothetical protein
VSWLKSQKWGIRLAGIWFVVAGITSLLSLSFQGLPQLLAILATAAGVLILMDR